MQSKSSIFKYFDELIFGPEIAREEYQEGISASSKAIEKRKKEMFKDVLAFPKGTEHLKYFDKNLHPDRFSDMELALSEAFAKKDLNPPLLLRKLEYEMVKKEIYQKMSALEKKVFSLPELFERLLREEVAKKDKNKHFVTAYSHLQGGSLDYLTSWIKDPNEPSPRWIDYNFAVDYAPAQLALKDLTANLWNDAAMENLTQKLAKAGALTTNTEYAPFYLWNTDPKNWSDMSYQARSVRYLNKPVFESWKYMFLPPQYWALGDYTINALPEGRVRYLGNGEHEVCIDKVFYFANDNFNFEGDQWLGAWLLTYDDKDGNKNTELTSLNNRFLRNIRKYGYGRYFPVLSRLHEAEGFTPDCRKVRSGRK